MARNEVTNITVFRKKWNINIGVVIFGVVFVYLIVTVLMYLTSTHVSVYEVREGTILKDRAYTGLALRDETVIYAEDSGYVNYFATEASKVGAKTKVYSLSPKELDFDKTDEQESAELTADERDALYIKTQSFGESFQAEHFNDVYTLKEDIQAVLESKSSKSRQAQLDEMLASGAEDIQVYSAVSDGIVLYTTDGYEETTAETVTEEMVSKQDYETVSIKNNTKLESGDPVYKLIKDDSWTLVIALDEDTAAELADTTRIKVCFTKDQQTERAGFSIRNTKDGALGFLTFDSSMIRYAQERYLDIELILEDETGLKIPKSSVVEKDFYVVPESYLTQGGNSQETGVLIDTGKDNAEFQKVDVYYKDSESGMAYLDPNAFDEDTTLLKPDSNDTYKLKDTKSLNGVYNINKGYAVFKQIQILCESEEYYIVESGSSYGLANYDHIALIGKDVQEDDIVF